MCDERLWQNLQLKLDSMYELIHVAIPNIHNLDDSIEFLDNFFAKEKINLFGFSLGAYIASYFAIKKPNRVKKLFLSSGTPGGISNEEINKRKQTIEMMKSSRLKNLSRKKIISVLEQKNQTNEKLISLIQNMHISLGKEAYITQMQIIINKIPLEKKLISLNIPINIFYSINDRLINHQSIEDLQNDYKHIQIVSIHGTSHMIPLELPNKLGDQIIAWMRL